MSGLLDGAVAVVCGGASGIGRAICERFAEHGASAVVIADLREEPREGGVPTAKLVTDHGAQAKFVPTDVAVPAQLERAVAAADEFGGVTVMVNDAGQFRSEDFLELDEGAYDEMMDVNVKGTFFGAQAAARRMVARADGQTGIIINLSSVGGIHGSPTSVTYSTSKGAVRLLTYALAGALGPRGIRVNALHPGLIETEMTRTDVPVIGTGAEDSIPLGRPGQPRDIADAAVFLASPLSSYVNGASLLVDGGATNSS